MTGLERKDRNCFSIWPIINRARARFGSLNALQEALSFLIGLERKDLNSFSSGLLLMELGQDLAHLAPYKKELS